MRQVLFRIPIPGQPDGLPIYGYGMMLFLAFVICTWLAVWRARKQGIPGELLQDLAIWLFVGGILGARIVFMIYYHQPIERFFFIWEGGLVFYGGLIGGSIAYLLAYLVLLRRIRIREILTAWWSGHGLRALFKARPPIVSGWKLADIVAPSAAIGLCLGRIGCLLNGCCYGHVACTDCPSISFYLSSMPRYHLVEEGWQTAAGFTMSATSRDRRTVGAVAAESAAADSGLQPGDIIVGADGHAIETYSDLWVYLTQNWPRGKNDLQLNVLRQGKEIALPTFVPRTLGLHPTQLYESISTLLLFLLLTAYFPYRLWDGSVMILFLILYPIHRFLNEMLRNDMKPVAFQMTLSQNGSLLVLLLAVGLALWLWRTHAPLSPDPVTPS